MDSLLPLASSLDTLNCKITYLVLVGWLSG